MLQASALWAWRLPRGLEHASYALGRALWHEEGGSCNGCPSFKSGGVENTYNQAQQGPRVGVSVWVVVDGCLPVQL